MCCSSPPLCLSRPSCSLTRCLSPLPPSLLPIHFLPFFQDLDIPDNLKDLYKTVWEIKQRVLVDMAADRGAFIDQSQSFNVHMSDPNFGKLTSLHFYAWKKGLKTGACCCWVCSWVWVWQAVSWACCCAGSLGQQQQHKESHLLTLPSPPPAPPAPPAGMYYLRTRAAADAIKFTVDQQALQRRKSERLAKASSADLTVGGVGVGG